MQIAYNVFNKCGFLSFFICSGDGGTLGGKIQINNSIIRQDSLHNFVISLVFMKSQIKNDSSVA